MQKCFERKKIPRRHLVKCRLGKIIYLKVFPYFPGSVAGAVVGSAAGAIACSVTGAVAGAITVAGVGVVAGSNFPRRTVTPPRNMGVSVKP